LTNNDEGENFTFSHVILFYSMIGGALAVSLAVWEAEGLPSGGPPLFYLWVMPSPCCRLIQNIAPG
jgi:hypothetical protein